MWYIHATTRPDIRWATSHTHRVSLVQPDFESEDRTETHNYRDDGTGYTKLESCDFESIQKASHVKRRRVRDHSVFGLGLLSPFPVSFPLTCPLASPFADFGFGASPAAAGAAADVGCGVLAFEGLGVPFLEFLFGATPLDMADRAL